jgi:photosystem II stability/assembly factor-like uncharacterized protein
VGGLPTNKTVNGFTVEPSNPKVMYAGMRDGLFKSADGGESWKRIAGEIKNVAAIAVSPKKPNELYVSTLDGTIYVSVDAGVKWKKAAVGGAKG